LVSFTIVHFAKKIICYLHCFDCYNVEKMFDTTQIYEFFHYNILHEPSIITMSVNTNKIQANVINDINKKREKYIT